MKPKNCQRCNKPIPIKRTKKSVFCSDRCRNMYFRLKQGKIKQEEANNRPSEAIEKREDKDVGSQEGFYRISR